MDGEEKSLYMQNRAGNQPRRKPQQKKTAGRSQRQNISSTRSAVPRPTGKTGNSYANVYRRQTRGRRKRAVSSAATVLVMMIMVSTVLLIVRNVDWEAVFADKNHTRFQNPDNVLYGPYLSDAERDTYLTQYVTVSAEDVYRGHCILVNPQHEYHFPSEEETDAVILSVLQNKTKSYKVNAGSMRLHIDTIQAMNRMMDDFYAETGSRDVMVNSAYRSKDGQQRTYDYYLRQNGEQYTKDHVQLPGFSEHHTGYAMDLAVFEEYEDGTSAMWSFDGRDKYFWVDKNCAQYGFILRYSASKESVTGIKYESWHYRFVGVANALAISNLGLSLEEYVIAIKNYTYDGDRYYVTAEDGSQYAVYYIPASGAETQNIPVPRIASAYDISGNNVDGFIVTAFIGHMVV